jgi:hypothetical protein
VAPISDSAVVATRAAAATMPTLRRTHKQIKGGQGEDDWMADILPEREPHRPFLSNQERPSLLLFFLTSATP